MSATLLFVLALVVIGLWYVAQRTRQQTGLPWATTLASDVNDALPNQETLIAHEYGLMGKPDYLLQRREGVIPVEVKPTRRAKQPYESDMMQLAAYCLLVETCLGERPPYGLLRYANQTFRIDYDDELRTDILAVITSMHTARQQSAGDRNHNTRSRCRGCGFVGQCDQSLFIESEEDDR